MGIFAGTTDYADVTDEHLLREEWSVRKMVEAIDLNRPGGSMNRPYL